MVASVIILICPSFFLLVEKSEMRKICDIGTDPDALLRGDTRAVLFAAESLRSKWKQRKRV
jgi:hypothetical protein